MSEHQTTGDPQRVPEASCFRKQSHGPHYWGQYQGDKYTKHCLGIGSERIEPSLPTREQIAEALWREENAAPSDVVTGTPWLRSSYFNQAAAVLALLQKTADR